MLWLARVYKGKGEWEIRLEFLDRECRLHSMIGGKEIDTHQKQHCFG